VVWLLNWIAFNIKVCIIDINGVDRILETPVSIAQYSLTALKFN